MVADWVLLFVSVLGLILIALALYCLASKVKDVKEQEFSAEDRNPEVGVGQRRRNEGEEGVDEEDNTQPMSKRDILKHEKRRAKIAMKQEEDARREARKERDERKMEILREKELEKDREFQIKEQLRLDREAKLAREYNSWKDPSLDATYSHHQNSFNNLFLDKLGGQKVVSVPSLAEETQLPLSVCLSFLQQFIRFRKLDGVIDRFGSFHLVDSQSLVLEQQHLTQHSDLLQKVINCERGG